MVREDVGRAISGNLRQLFEVNHNITLDYVSECSGVPVTTVFRVKSGEGGLQSRTASKLAQFLESETKGKVRADRLLGESRRRNYLDADLVNADLTGEDLRDCDFRGAKLRGAKLKGARIDGAKFDLANMREVDLSDVTGTASFRCAILESATIRNVVVDWDLTGVQGRNMVLRNVTFEEAVRMGGADLSGNDADWSGVVWRTIGSRTLGAKLPKINPMEISEGFCDHLVLVRGLEEAFGIDLEKDEGDPEILHFAEFMLARESSLLRCYDGGAKRLLNRHESRIDDILKGWGTFPWYAKERLEIALHVRTNCQTVTDYNCLRESVFYSDDFMPFSEGNEGRGAKAIIEKYIHRAKRGQMMHLI